MILWASLNSIAILLLALIQFLSIRQIGLMLTRLGPIGARSEDGEGPRVGEHIHVQVEPLRSELPDVFGDTLFLFGSHACSICKDIRRSAERLAPHWRNDVRIVVIYDEPDDGTESKVDRQGDDELPVFNGGMAIRTSLGISGVPYGVRVDGADRVLGKGLVNSISHVESLLELGGELRVNAESVA